jgi:hypothetical protein
MNGQKKMWYPYMVEYHLLIKKNQWNPVICNMNEQEIMKWNKPGTERQIAHDLTQRQNVNSWSHWY